MFLFPWVYLHIYESFYLYPVNLIVTISYLSLIYILFMYAVTSVYYINI